MNSHCPEDEQCSLEANGEFLTLGNVEVHHGEYSGDAEIKVKNHCCRLQK